MSNNRLVEAIAICEQALHPTLHVKDFQPAAQRVGNILQSNGRFDEAVLWHTQAQTKTPELAQIYQGLGTIYVQQQLWEKAIAAYQLVLEYDPDISAAYWQLASLYRQQGQQEHARLYWYKALAFEPEKATLEQHLKLGHLLQQQGRIKESLNCYRRAIYLEKNYFPAYRALAEGFRQQGRLADAIAIYEEAVTRVTKPGLLYSDLGHLFQKQGQWDKAIATFRAGSENDLGYPWNVHHWVNALLQKERWNDAIAVSQATIARSPETPWAYVQLGRAFMAIGQREEAILCNQKACAVRGWKTCPSIGYEFSYDWFSRHIPVWTQYLDVWVGQPDTQALEVGSFQGMSACWLLDHVLTHPSSHLTCVDSYFQPEFSRNIAKTKTTASVTTHLGTSESLWPQLPDETFAFIYIDGSKDATVIQTDGQHAWTKLKPGGILIFNDYHWSNPKHPDLVPKHGIDAVLRKVKPQATVLSQKAQVILCKNTPPANVV